jgi:WXG100 family type VII secretion target
MSEAFRVDPEKLGDAVQHMADFGRYAESMLAEIDRLVTHLHATWSGAGAAAHAEAHRHWASGEAMMREALAQLRAAGAAAHHNYTAAVSTNSAMWS